MAGVIDKFVFALFLDTKNFKQGADVAERSVNGLRRTILQAYTAIGGIDIFRRMITDYSNTSVELGRLSEVTGESLKELEAWKLTIRDAGSDTGSFFGTLKMLNDEMGNLQNFGSSNLPMILNRIGVWVTSDGKLKKGTQLLKDIAGALSKFDKRQAINFGKTLGLDEGTVIVLQRYGEGIGKLVKQNEKRALITQEDVLNGMAYQKMLSELKQTFLSLKKAVVPEILKAMKEIMPQLEAGLLAVIPLFKNLLSIIAPTAEVLAEIAKFFEKVGGSFATYNAYLNENAKKNPLDNKFSDSYLGKGVSAVGHIFSKDMILSALGGSGLTNITIEALNISTQATDAQGVAKVTAKYIGDLPNQAGG